MNEEQKMARQIGERVLEHERSNRLVFQGTEAHRILQCLCYLEQVPPLTVVCERGTQLPPIEIEQFVPVDFRTHNQDQLVEIIGTAGEDIHSVYIHKTDNYHIGGTLLSFVVAEPSDFPHTELASFPTPVLEQARPPRAHILD